MKYKTGFLVTACLLFMWAGPVPAMQSANYKITTSVMSGAGGSMTSATYASHSVLGQPSPIMARGVAPVSENYQIYPGYVFTLISDGLCPWDLSWPLDGDVDGLDLYQFIYDGYDHARYLEEFINEFGRDDCF